MTDDEHAAWEPEKAGVHFAEIWYDEDLIECRIRVSDGTSRFVSNVYVTPDCLEHAVAELRALQEHLEDGQVDVQFGTFGSGFASGAFHARFHYPRPGRLHVTCRQETQHEEFGGKEVASCATMHLQSEPGLLDRFISELAAIARHARTEAWLEGS